MKTELLDHDTLIANPPKRAADTPRIDSGVKLSELKISYRRRPRKKTLAQVERPILDSPEECFHYLRRVWDQDTLELREEFVLICLDHALAVNGWIRLHAGGIGECAVDLRLLFAVALKTASSGIVIAHNHPSGSLTPSEVDRRITKRVAAAGKLLGVRLIDHLIVSTRGFYTFNEGESELFETDEIMTLLEGDRCQQ